MTSATRTSWRARLLRRRRGGRSRARTEHGQASSRHTREEVVAAIGALKSRALAAEAQRDARPDFRGMPPNWCAWITRSSPTGRPTVQRLHCESKPPLREHAKG